MSSTPGRLYGVGLGPGDPEFITRKAARLIAEADVIAYYSGTHGRSIARSIAADVIPEGVIEEKLVYPVTTGTTDHPGGYEGAITEFYDASAQRLAAHLSQGRDVVVLCEGDPLFYGSYMYLHDRLASGFHRDRPRCDVDIRGFCCGGVPARAPHRRVDDPPRDPAPTRAGPATGRH